MPVLPREVFELLGPQPGGCYVDCTAGLGGHASQAAGLVGPDGTVVLCDLDAGMLARAEARVRDAAVGCRVLAVQGSFARLPERLAELGLAADCLLADLGFASPHVDDPDRGFSFRRDGPLDMRLDPTSGPSAADLIATASEAELAEILWTFGEERNARRIARKVVASREAAPIVTTRGLAALVRSCTRGGSIDAATRTFQALRIAVNDELGSLSSLLASIGDAARLPSGSTWVAPGARIAMISFHSLEDRLVKRAFADLASNGLAERLTRKPATASDAEAAANRRARSAKLRAVRLSTTRS